MTKQKHEYSPGNPDTAATNPSPETNSDAELHKGETPLRVEFDPGHIPVVTLKDIQELEGIVNTMLDAGIDESTVQNAIDTTLKEKWGVDFEKTESGSDIAVHMVSDDDRENNPGVTQPTVIATTPEQLGTSIDNVELVERQHGDQELAINASDEGIHAVPTDEGDEVGSPLEYEGDEMEDTLGALRKELEDRIKALPEQIEASKNRLDRSVPINNCVSDLQWQLDRMQYDGDTDIANLRSYFATGIQQAYVLAGEAREHATSDMKAAEEFEAFVVSSGQALEAMDPTDGSKEAVAAVLNGLSEEATQLRADTTQMYSSAATMANALESILDVISRSPGNSYSSPAEALTRATSSLVDEFERYAILSGSVEKSRVAIRGDSSPQNE